MKNWHRDAPSVPVMPYNTLIHKATPMTIDTSTCINILPDEEYYYSVEDTNIAVGCDGCTISYWQDQKRHTHIEMNSDEALAIADAIYKLFKKN